MFELVRSLVGHFIKTDRAVKKIDLDYNELINEDIRYVCRYIRDRGNLVQEILEELYGEESAYQIINRVGLPVGFQDISAEIYNTDANYQSKKYYPRTKAEYVFSQLTVINDFVLRGPKKIAYSELIGILPGFPYNAECMEGIHKIMSDIQDGMVSRLMISFAERIKKKGLPLKMYEEDFNPKDVGANTKDDEPKPKYDMFEILRKILANGGGYGISGEAHLANNEQSYILITRIDGIDSYIEDHSGGIK